MEYIYYLKKCCSQELGSIDKNKQVNRGRYLYTSKNSDILSIFPALTQTKKNDFVLLPIIPLYSDKHIKVYCNFVYHNDKFHESQAKHPRDEYRLYLNNELENQNRYFEKDDIVIIRKDNIIENGENEIVYLLDLVKNKNSELYKSLDKIIKEPSIQGNYGICKGVIPEFENKYSELKKKNITKVIIDKKITEVLEKCSKKTVEDLFNKSNFRDFVMVGYENLCAITGMVIEYGNYTNLEAAHIKPKSHKGSFRPNNGIAMSRDMHWAFDKGFFSLTDEYKIQVHPETTSEYLWTFNDKQIKLPVDDFFKPDLENIRYHRENVYGFFCK